MAEAKGGAEIWAAGIGRKSNAQYGSDLMVEVLRELGIKYIALNPGASYRGLHDSLVNFEGGKGPEMIMADAALKDEMNAAWMAWVDRSSLPTRTAVGAVLTPGTLVEIAICAAK